MHISVHDKLVVVKDLLSKVVSDIPWESNYIRINICLPAAIISQRDILIFFHLIQSIFDTSGIQINFMRSHCIIYVSLEIQILITEGQIRRLFLDQWTIVKSPSSSIIIFSCRNFLEYFTSEKSK